MKKIVLIVLTLSLNISCCHAVSGGSFGPVVVYERCSIDTKNMKCYCHLYKIKNGFVGKVSDTETKNLDYCDKLIGSSPDDWNNIHTLLMETFVW